MATRDTYPWAWALEMLDKGWYVRRESWPSDRWLKLEHEDLRCTGTPEAGIVMLSDQRMKKGGRHPHAMRYADMAARDWTATQNPVLALPYSEAELLLQAKSWPPDTPIYVQPPTDRLQQEHFIQVGGAPPEGMEFRTVKLAVSGHRGSKDE